MVFVFAGGGTGGHLYPAVALAQELLRRIPEAEIHFIGTRQGIEARVVPGLGFPLHLIDVRGLSRSFSPSNLLVPLRLLKSLVQSVRLLQRLQPKAVIGTGGYVSGPVLASAVLLRLPTVIQEQNSLPGVTTRLLARVVDRVHISFEESSRYLRSGSLRLSGNPVRRPLNDKSPQEARRVFDLAPDRPTLLLFGGSQGARALNDALLGALPKLMAESELQVLWSAGAIDYERIHRSAAAFGERVRVLPFIDDMVSAYRAADLAVTRSGALTLAELALWGLPSILVPYPYAAAGHQEHNARAFADRGAAVMILQRDLTSERLAEMIFELLRDPERRKSMGEQARRAAFAHAAEEIVDSVLQLVAEER